MKIYPLILLGMAVVFSTATLQSQEANAIDRYFKQYLEDDRFSVVYISPKVFQLLDRIDLGDVEVNGKQTELVKDLADDLRGLRILTTDERPDEFYREAKERIDTKAYELLMTVRSKNRSNVEFLIHENEEGIITELLMLAGGDESFTLLSFVGKINLETVSRLADEIDED
ncbi:MAG: DUF4252 domain-containing protein [Bacteroidota bacterium]